MAAGKRIRTPWKHRWRRFRYSVLPFLFFAGFVVVTARLWERQIRPTQAVGEVDAVRVPVSANVDGPTRAAAAAKSENWVFGDEVRKDDIVARLDDSEALAAAETINARIEELNKQLDSVGEQARVDQFDRDYDHNREQTRLTLQHQGLLVQGLQLDVDINFDEIEAQRLKTRLKFFDEANRRNRDVVPVARQTIEETRTAIGRHH